MPGDREPSGAFSPVSAVTAAKVVQEALAEEAAKGPERPLGDAELEGFLTVAWPTKLGQVN